MDGKPATLPSLTTSATATPSQPNAQTTNAAEARRFVEQYYREVNEAVQSGEATQLANLSLPTCVCRELVQFVSQQADGSRLSGGAIHVKRIDVTEIGATSAVVRVRYDAMAGRILDGSGKERRSFAATMGAEDDLALVRTGSQWRLSNVFPVNA